MNIKIENCNNIDEADITLFEKKLNIKFAPNGTGKSTIAKALEIKANNGSNFDELTPFKLRDENPENKKPNITGLENINSIMCFNEEYVNQFVFKQDELLNSSFDILIKTDSYKEKEREINELVGGIKNLFINNDELENLITTLKDLGGAFKLTKSGLSKSSTGMKGLVGGNKIEHIPEGLESYRPFIQCDNSVNWVDWQTKGYSYAELSDSCPFCTSDVADKKEQITTVGEHYDKSTIKNLISIISVIESLGEYFSDDTRSKLIEITKLKDGLEKEHEDFLVGVKTQIDTFIDKLENLKTLSAFKFEENEQVFQKLQSFKLDLTFLDKIDSAKTKEAIQPLNQSIDSMVEKAGVLQGKINQQRGEMKRVIEKHQENINNFLSYAGYKYQVEISGEKENTRLRLLHIDYSEKIMGGSQHLSFGERNAFAIVLFMYECLSKTPDLIILDDPISSFDKNKKYAILEMLFRRDAAVCFKSKTVLMLTHDVEPIIDTVKSLAGKFSTETTVASFLKLNSGVIVEKEIRRDDIKTFSQICNDALKSDKENIIKLIYLRRYFETIDDKSDAYQVLSNLLHKREYEDATDTRKSKNDDGKYPQLEQDKFENGCRDIKQKLASFDYADTVATLKNISALTSIYGDCQNGYEKLQLCRLIDHVEDKPVIEKFIKETYHIENEFICQLDPVDFDTIPEYVVSACDDIVKSV